MAPSRGNGSATAVPAKSNTAADKASAFAGRNQSGNRRVIWSPQSCQLIFASFFPCTNGQVLQWNVTSAPCVLTRQCRNCSALDGQRVGSRNSLVSAGGR